MVLLFVSIHREEAICSKSCANERRTELARVLPSAAKII